MGWEPQDGLCADTGSVRYKGGWNASSNTPNLSSSSPRKGYYYVVSTAGSTSLGGITSWGIGDWAIYNGATWDKVDNTDAVASVAGRTGAVTLAVADVSGAEATANKALANGYASLDAGGKVPVAQLPDTVVGAVDYKGSWNASTNSPDLPGSSPAKGDYYVVSTGGSTSLGGITSWNQGDWAIYNGSAWEKVDNTDAVISVAGKTGAVALVVGDISGAEATANKGATNGYASLNASSKVVQDPANATATPAVSKIPIADGSGKLDGWVTYKPGGTDVAVADGGTGASDAGTARTNLGLGSIATQSAGSVAITGGSVAGITDLAVADGGTGASDAATARTNLGLGSIATQAANNVGISGGSVTGIADLAVADGGTGASNATTAFNNLSPLTTEGDLLRRDGTNNSRLARGNQGQILAANPTTLIWRDEARDAVMTPRGVYVGAPTGVTAAQSGTTYFVYLGRVATPMASVDVVTRVTTAAATITWAEIAIFKGAVVANANASLTRVAFANVAAVFNSTGVKKVTINVSLAAGDDLWFAWASSATTPFQLRGMIADDIQSGVVQSWVGRPSLAASPQVTTLGANTLAPAWVTVRV